MYPNGTQQKVITTVEDEPNRHLVRKTTREVEPQVVGDTPQKVYDKRKTILRVDQIIWYVLALVEALIIFRILLKILGADPIAGFARFVYALSNPLISPFRGIFSVFVTGNTVIEWSAIIAAIVYVAIAWGIVYLLDLVYPITPKDVETL